MANLFERLSGSQSAPAPLEKKDQKRRDEKQEFSDAQKLLDFLQRWPQNTICLRDIYIFGPYVLQNEKEAALEAAEILVRHGWLVPQPVPHKTNHPPRRVWQVLRKPIIRPTVAGTRT